jgi:formamidopyrimidine-DNA glycosylase
MPELPEVETTCRGIAPHIIGQRITRVVVRERRLRHLIPRQFAARVTGAKIAGVSRRGKYLLVVCNAGTLIIHLGMSGNLRLVPAAKPAEKHDHVDLQLSNGLALRLRDPRRFGLMVWTEEDPLLHPLLRGLGPEPLTAAFTGAYLAKRAGNRSVPIKQFIMDAKIVVGVGNIYANEALFMAGVHPRRPAGEVTATECALIAKAIKRVLRRAIAAGGTTLRDYVDGAGRSGYFSQQLAVYGRAGQPCPRCAQPIEMVRMGQRATFFCPHCQT